MPDTQPLVAPDIQTLESLCISDDILSRAHTGQSLQELEHREDISMLSVTTASEYGYLTRAAAEAYYDTRIRGWRVESWLDLKKTISWYKFQQQQFHLQKASPAYKWMTFRKTLVLKAFTTAVGENIAWRVVSYIAAFEFVFMLPSNLWP